MTLTKNHILQIFKYVLDKKRRRRFLIDLFIFFRMVPNLNQNKKHSAQCVISLTSYGYRVRHSVHYVLFSLLNQTIKPNRIILWLDKDNWNSQNIPTQLYRISKLSGIEILFCGDIRSYKKIIPALQLNLGIPIVTADDDIYYPTEWLKSLINEHVSHSNAIICHRAHQISVSRDGKIHPYMNWNFCVKDCPANLIFPTFGAGALFPPNSLHAISTDEAQFLELCPTADDIWLWAMAKLNETPIRIVENGISDLDYINLNDQKNSLFTINGNGGENDRQLQNIINTFHFNL